jgi:hypothetical protein
MTSSDRPRFDALLRRVLDASANSMPPLAELEAALRDDPRLVEEYVGQIEIDTLLAWELGPAEGGDITASGGASVTLPAPSARVRQLAWLATALLIGTGIGLGLDALRPRKQSQPPAVDDAVAVLIDSEDATWSNLPASPAFGATFTQGQSLELVTGVARMAMRNRAGIAIEAPASIDLVSADSILVRNGRVSAYAPDEAIGFTLRTPDVEIVDLGTRFATNVTPDGLTEVHVFDGAISVKPRQGDVARGIASSELVATGQARRYQAAGGRTEITIDESGFLEPPVIEQLIAAASDRGRLRSALFGPKAALSEPLPGTLASLDFSGRRAAGDAKLRGICAALPPMAGEAFVGLVAPAASHAGDAVAGGYLVVRGREAAEPFLVNRLQVRLAAPLPNRFHFGIRAAYHGLDADDFIGLWIDHDVAENASHCDAPTIGIREEGAFGRTDLSHTAISGRIGGSSWFTLVGRYEEIVTDTGERRARLAVWLDPRPGDDPDSVIDGPPPPAAGRLDALGIRVGRHTEIDDRLLIHRIAVAAELDDVLAALGDMPERGVP